MANQEDPDHYLEVLKRELQSGLYVGVTRTRGAADLVWLAVDTQVLSLTSDPSPRAHAWAGFSQAIVFKELSDVLAERTMERTTLLHRIFGYCMAGWSVHIVHSPCIQARQPLTADAGSNLASGGTT